MHKLKRFVNTAVTYLAGNVLSKLVTFFMIPLYTNRLAPEQYGDYDLIVTIVTLFVSLAFFQIWDGMFRFSFDYSKESDKYDLIYNALIVYLFGLVVYSVLFMALKKVFDVSLWQYAYAYGIFFALQYMYTFMARVFLKNKLFVFSGTVNTFLTALCNVVFILYFNLGVKSLYMAQIVGCIAQIIIIGVNLHPISEIHIKNINLNWIKAMLSFSIPLCVSTISYWLLSGFTKVVINKSLGSYENGIYAVANSLANIAVMAVNIFQFAWNEMAYMMADEEGRTVFYKKCVDLLFITVAFGCAIVCLGIKVLFPFLVGEQYINAKEVIPILMIGVSANSIAGFLGTLFMTEKKTSYILYSTLIAAALNLSCSYYITKLFGIRGAVICLVASFVLLMVLRLIQMRMVLKVSLSFKAVLTSVFVVIAFVVYEVCDSVWICILSAIVFALIYLLILSRAFKFNVIQMIRRKQ